MIKYDRFWETLKKRHISQYYLINECGIEKGYCADFGTMKM